MVTLIKQLDLFARCKHYSSHIPKEAAAYVQLLATKSNILSIDKAMNKIIFACNPDVRTIREQFHN